MGVHVIWKQNIMKLAKLDKISQENCEKGFCECVKNPLMSSPA